MNTNRTTYSLAVCLMLAGSTLAQEKKTDLSELPKAVEKTVQEQSNGATVRGFSKEKENGKIAYEAEMIANGQTKVVLIEPCCKMDLPESSQLAAGARIAISERRGEVISALA